MNVDTPLLSPSPSSGDNESDREEKEEEKDKKDNEKEEGEENEAKKVNVQIEGRIISLLFYRLMNLIMSVLKEHTLKQGGMSIVTCIDMFIIRL